MIIKTNLSGRQRNVGSAFYMGRLNGYCAFICTCGVWFELRSTNKYVSDEQYRCPTCKRRGALAPFIGERYIYRRIRSDAKFAKREFAIDFDWFVRVCHLPCYYCGASDGNSTTVPSKVVGDVLLKDFRYNGLDRIDNAIGYRESNCVPCCIICNRAKNSMSYSDFIHWINSMIKYREMV